MTRIFTDGAELGDILFFNGGNLTATTSQFASGAYSYKIAYTQSGWKNLSPALSEFYFKERVRKNVYGNTSDRYVEFRWGTTELGYVSQDGLGRWIGVINGITLGVSVPTMIYDQWYCLEVHFKIDAINGVFEVKVDGNVMFTFNGDTTFIGGFSAVDNLYWVQAGANPVVYIDDLALNDTAGGVDDGYCGGGRVIKLKPVGDAGVNWNGSDGNKVNNWQLVDDIPKDDDTTYVYTDAGTPGTIDEYNVETYVGTDRSVERIWVECRARKTIAAAATLKIGFDTLSSVNVDDVGILNELYNLRLVGDEYLVNPDDSNPWMEADLNLMLLVIESG
jgi:hypothetical protein